LSIPQGRLDLIPEDYEIIDKRVVESVPFPTPKYPLRPEQQVVYDPIDDTCFINALVGWGKTFTALHLAHKFGQKTLVITHTAALRDQWCEEIAVLFGQEPGVIGGGRIDHADHFITVANIQTLAKHTGDLAKEFGTIILDEAHHMGPRCMNVIKTLVNRTPGEFVLMGIPSLLAKMERNAYIEAKQLSTNRLSERVKFAFNERAIQTYLTNIFPDATKEELTMASKMIYPSATNNGCYAFVRDVARNIRASGLTSKAVKDAVDKVNDKRRK
jgi:superfamily II DNA or RNA helicase